MGPVPSNLDDKDPVIEEFTAELQDARSHKIVYVIGEYCRFHHVRIDRCGCGVCEELRGSCDSTYFFNSTDDYHYIWCSRYDVVVPWVLNSLPEHALLGYGPQPRDYEPFDGWNDDDSDGDDGDDQGDEDEDDEDTNQDDSTYMKWLRAMPKASNLHGSYRKRKASEDSQKQNKKSKTTSAGACDEPMLSIASVTVVEIDNVHDPFAAKVQADVKPGQVEATDIIADSGATRHMFPHIDYFTNYREVKGHFVRVANGKVVPAVGIGDIGPLRNVLHVPGLVYALVSESELDRDGKWLVSGNGQRVYYERSPKGSIDYGKVFLTAKLNGKGLYLVNPMFLGMPNPDYNYTCFDALATKTEAVDLLHKTLGHVSVERLQDWVHILV